MSSDGGLNRELKTPPRYPSPSPRPSTERGNLRRGCESYSLGSFPDSTLAWLYLGPLGCVSQTKSNMLSWICGHFISHSHCNIFPLHFENESISDSFSIIISLRSAHPGALLKQGVGLRNLRKHSTVHEAHSTRTREPAEETPWSPLAALS